jgi:GAF domain-containing protein
VPAVSRGTAQWAGFPSRYVFSAGRLFSEADLRPMTLLAEQAAISIVNSRHYETERRRVAELQQLTGT